MLLARIGVTGRAVFDVPNALVEMLRADPPLGMRMAAETRVLRIVVADVAGVTGLVVTTIEHEEFIVFEAGRRPAVGRMALAALRIGFLMHPIGGRDVTADAARAGCGAKLGV